jgi:hypothetical protein
MIIYYTVNDPVFSDFMSLEISEAIIEDFGVESVAEMCADNYQMNGNWEGEYQNDFYIWQVEGLLIKLLGKCVVFVDYEPTFTAFSEKPEVPVEKQVTSAYVESLTPYMTKPK